MEGRGIQGQSGKKRGAVRRAAASIMLGDLNHDMAMLGARYTAANG